MVGHRSGLHVSVSLALYYHMCIASFVAPKQDTFEAEGRSGHFRQKRELRRLPVLEPILRKVNQLQTNGGSVRNPNGDVRESADREKRTADESEDNADAVLSVRELPSEHKLYLKLAEDTALDVSTKQELRRAVAELLGVPESHVLLAASATGESEVEMAVLSSEATGHSLRDFLPTKQMEENLATSSEQLPGLLGRELYVRDVVDTEAAESDELSQASLAYAVGGSAMVLVGFILLTVWCFLRWRRGKSGGTSGHSSPSPPPHIPQQICLYPSATPQVKDATLIQPDVTQILTNKSCGECGTPVHTPPMKMKGKGLLERRGSQASLTLDLGPPTPDAKPAWGSPPKESSAEEYLLSAGNRMSRKQLRNCLRNTKLLHEEFWEIPMNHPDRVVEPGSGVKNRYRTIIPNDHSRVVLPQLGEDPLSTYINANYIRGYAGEARAFIATQGPMSHTVNDFWRAVWHVKSPIVVMITKLKEKNKILLQLIASPLQTKCDNYMPEVGSASYGDITISVESVTEEEGYTLRQLELQYSNECHKVLHYWYTAWPDHKAPDTARQLLDLVKEVETRRYTTSQQAKGPVIVHCSAGIGRTGCFIAASIGLRQLREEHMVDILGMVCQMRLDRGGMVQTNEQYEFVHQVLCLYERELPLRPPSCE